MYFLRPKSETAEQIWMKHITYRIPYILSLQLWTIIEFYKPQLYIDFQVYILFSFNTV
jgi:hypothetical protein